jgi:hypothetical protein
MACPACSRRDCASSDRACTCAVLDVFGVRNHHSAGSCPEAHRGTPGWRKGSWQTVSRTMAMWICVSLAAARGYRLSKDARPVRCCSFDCWPYQRAGCRINALNLSNIARTTASSVLCTRNHDFLLRRVSHSGLLRDLDESGPAMNDCKPQPSGRPRGLPRPVRANPSSSCPQWLAQPSDSTPSASSIVVRAPLWWTPSSSSRHGHERGG